MRERMNICMPSMFWILMLCLAASGLWRPAWCAETGSDPIPELHRHLMESRQLVRHMLATLATGGDIDHRFERLKALTERVSRAHAKIGTQLGRRTERISALGARAAGRHRTLMQTYGLALEAYLNRVQTLERSAPDLGARLSEILEMLDAMLPAPLTPLYGQLPYRQPDFAVLEPVSTAAITPAYLGGDAAVGSADTEICPEGSDSGSIVAKATELECHPLKIYAWVKNNVATEWYWGCMQGAAETLRRRSGNDCDQAALLVALLRAAGFPARYLRGVVRFFPDLDTARNLLGIEDAHGMAAFLRKAGIPFRPVVTGGRITNLEFEHVWVQSRIPYAHYRGTLLDRRGEVWLALDTAIKSAGYSIQAPSDPGVGFNWTQLAEDYLSRRRDERFVPYLRSQIEGWLQTNAPELTYSQLLHDRILNPEALGLLPASLQFDTVRVTHEYTCLPSELLQQIGFAARGPDGKDLFATVVDAHGLVPAGVTLTAEPENVEDQEIINAHGGLDNTPAYLVHLRPVLRSGGRRLAVAARGYPPGTPFSLETRLTAPGGQVESTNTHIIGHVAVMGFFPSGVGGHAGTLDPGPGAEELMRTALNRFGDQCYQSERELAALLGVAVARPLPGLVTVGAQVAVNRLLDVPLDVHWQGLYVDADLRLAAPVEISARPAGENSGRTFMSLAGLAGSVLEGWVLTREFEVPGISTAGLLGLAAERGLGWVDLDAGNLAVVLGQLNAAENIAADLQAALDRGYAVRIVPAVMPWSDWSGIGYVKSDAATGSSGWMLSGGIAGAMTALTPENWPRHLQNSFLYPFSVEPQTDASATATIQKVPASDLQQDIVGQTLTTDLAVLVRDAKMLPVAGAEVTFTILAGGGSLNADGLEAEGQTSVGAISSRDGIARASLTLGEHTDANPTDWWEPGDVYAQQVGGNIVTAVLANGTELVAPFSAFGFPDEPRVMRKLGQEGIQSHILSFAGFMAVVVEDQYANPIANLPVTFTALPAIDRSGCANPNQDLREAQLVLADDPCLEQVPVHGQCQSGNTSLEVPTSSQGTYVNIVMGALPGAEYPVRVSCAGLEQTFLRHSLAFGNCGGVSRPGLEFVLMYAYTTDWQGRAIDAVRVGESLPLRAKCYLLREGSAGDVGDRNYAVDTGIEATVTFGGLQGTHLGDGVYQAMVPLASGARLNHIPVSASTEVEGSIRSAGLWVPGYGVDILTADEIAVMVSPTGVLARDTAIHYAIQPPSRDLLRESFRTIVASSEPELETALTDRFMGALNGEVLEDLLAQSSPQLMEGIVSDLPAQMPEAFRDAARDLIEPRLAELVSRLLPLVQATLCDYRADTAHVAILRDGQPVTHLIAETSGEGSATLARGFAFEPNGVYTAQVVLNAGSGVEIRSDPILLDVGILRQTPVDDQCSLIDKSERVASRVDLTRGEYRDSQVDLAVQNAGLPLEVRRRFFDGRWQFDLHRRLQFVHNGFDDHNPSKIICDGVSFEPDSETPGSYVFRTDPNYAGSRRIQVDGDGYLWTDLNHNWRRYDAGGRLQAYGRLSGGQIALLYADEDEDVLVGAADKAGNQLLWFENNAQGYISAVIDAEGRRVSYEYESGRLSAVVDVLAHTTRYVYDDRGRLSSRKDPAGRITVLDYNDRGQIRQVTAPDGSFKQFDYAYDLSADQTRTRVTTTSGRVRTVWFDRYDRKVREDINGRTVYRADYVELRCTEVDAAGRKTVKTYDPNGNLLESIFPDGGRTAFEYDPVLNKRTKAEDEAGVVSAYGYDGAGNLIKKIEAQGTTVERTFEYAYDGVGNLVTVRQLADDLTAEAVTTMTYDATGNLITQIDSEGNTTQSTHDIMGNVLSREDPRGKLWQYGYDAAGHLLEFIDPLGNPTRQVYDPAGNRVKTIDAAGRETIFVYDPMDRLLERTDALGQTKIWEYDSDGQPVRQIDAEGKQVEYEYDPDGRLVKTIDGNGNEIVQVYDNDLYPGCPACNSTDGDLPGKILYPTFERVLQYDSRGRKTAQTDVKAPGDEVTTRFDYDTRGNLIARTDAEIRKTLYTYDALGRLITVQDAAGGITTYEYDSRGNLIALNDAEGNTTRFEYDRINRLAKEIRPLGQETIYAYDGTGNLVAKIDPKNQKSAYAYDDAARLVMIRYFNAGDHENPVKTVNFAYDIIGNLTGYDDGITSAVYEYDETGRKISETVDYGSFTKSYAYAYYQNSTKKAFTGPDGVSYSYNYDSNNQLTSVTLPETGIIRVADYTWNQPQTVTLPGGTQKRMQYDALMRLKSIETTGPDENVLLQYRYTYDKMDNITEKETEHGDYIYGYDDLNRLTSADNPEQDDEAFTYDSVGNRLTSAATTGPWSYNTNNELEGYDNIAYQYDDNGNTIQKTTGDVVTSYVYNIEDRLAEVWDGETGTGSLTASYYYDPFGRRLWKNVSGARTHFLYSDEGLIGEYDSSGNEIKTYGYKPGSNWSTDPLFMKIGTYYYYYQNDHLGTPQKMIDGTGSVVWRAKYNSYGETQVGLASTAENNFRFGGQYYDAETRLRYNYYRYYYPQTGRYLTIDPVGSEPNKLLLAKYNCPYAYSSLSPIVQIDPLGLFPLSPSCIASIITAKFSCDDYSSASEDYRGFLRWCGDCWDWCTYERFKKSCNQKYKPEPTPTNEDCMWFGGFAAPSHAIIACKKTEKGEGLASKSWMHGANCLSAIIKVAVSCSVKP